MSHTFYVDVSEYFSSFTSNTRMFVQWKQNNVSKLANGQLNQTQIKIQIQFIHIDDYQTLNEYWNHAVLKTNNGCLIILTVDYKRIYFHSFLPSLFFIHHHHTIGYTLHRPLEYTHFCESWCYVNHQPSAI